MTAETTSAQTAKSTRILKRLTVLLCIAAIRVPLAALPTTSVLFENLVGGDTPPESALTDFGGTTALDAGTPMDGDGDLVELGYFTESTTSAGFSGEWVPLTGPASANPGLPNTSIGDTGSNESGPFGFFTRQVNFDQNNSDTFQNIPEVGTRLAVAVYNGTTSANSTHFNIATNDAWQWKAPGIIPDLVSINLNSDGTTWFGGTSSTGSTTQPISEFPGVTPSSRLINISTRGYSGTGDQQLISGFVLAGSSAKQVLIRAIGPSLEDFGLTGVMEDPVLRLTQAADGEQVAINDNWSDQANVSEIEAAFSTTGAFPIERGTSDAVLLLDLDPIGGGYTAQITDATATGGVVIAEVYSVSDEPGDTRLINISTRGYVGTGEQLMIPGFAIGSGSARRLLIRAAGPALAQEPFNLQGTLPDPVLQVFTGSPSELVAENTNWEDDGQGATITEAGNSVGAFPLPNGTRDAALIFETPADQAYTVQITSETGQTGIVIAEIYELQ